MDTDAHKSLSSDEFCWAEGDSLGAHMGMHCFLFNRFNGLGLF